MDIDLLIDVLNKSLENLELFIKDREEFGHRLISTEVILSKRNLYLKEILLAKKTPPTPFVVAIFDDGSIYAIRANNAFVLINGEFVPIKDSGWIEFNLT